MRSSLRTAIVIGVMLVVLAGVGVLALWGFGGQRPAVASIEKIQARQGVPVHVSGLERRSFTDYVLCDGNVAADVRALLRSKIEEIVEDVSVRVGEPVSKGQVVVVLRDTDIRAAIEAARAAHDEATSNYRRYANLANEGVIAPDRLEQARTAVETAQARLQAEQSRLQFTRIESPIDGIVEERWVEPGEFKGVGGQLLSILDLSTVEVCALVPQRHMALIRPGATGEFRLEGRDDWLTGVVSRISPATSDPNRFFEVRLKVENPLTDGQWLLRPGMFAEVRFVRRVSNDAVCVPESAVRYEGSERIIYVVSTARVQVPAAAVQDPGNGNTFVARLRRGLKKLLHGGQETANRPAAEWIEGQVAKRVAITPGLTDGGYAEVTDNGLAADALVVLNPRDDIRDGTLLRAVQKGD